MIKHVIRTCYDNFNVAKNLFHLRVIYLSIVMYTTKKSDNIIVHCTFVNLNHPYYVKGNVVRLKAYMFNLLSCC